MDGMVLTIIVVVAVAVIVIAAAFAYGVMQRRRSEGLQREFGDEYDRTVQDSGSRGRAESELDKRRKRVDALNIKPLSPEDRDRYAEAWTSAQAKFVDDPEGAVGDADRLVGEVMQKRGYPVGDFEQRAADVSVNHPNVVKNYRHAHDIAESQERGEASTDDLRDAMVSYRELFNDLLDVKGGMRRAG